MALHVNQPAEEATHGDSTVCASEASGLVATANPQATSMHPCVAVIGMGRSGTSATAGLLVSLGLTGPSGDDLLPATSSNERGHWESIAVIACNSRLLRAVGATTTGPPPVTLEWDDVPDHAARLAEAEEWYRDTYTGAPIVVKDPRMCLTLSFWRKALPQPLAALFVLRDPLSVARSLQARDGLPMSLGLALWDRYVRSASLGLAGMPTLVIRYDEMLSDPIKATSTIVEFLNTLGIELLPEAQENARKGLDPGLRHHRLQADDYSEMAAVQSEAFELLVARVGTHVAWTPPSMPEPPLWVEDCIALARDYGLAERRMRRSLRQMRRSRTYRFASMLRRAAGR